MKYNPKSQKGAITLIVLVTMLFLTAFIMTMYIKLSNKAGISAETTAEIAKKYNNIGDKNNIYYSYMTDSNIIPITNRDELKEIGSNKNITINGKIYKFKPDGNYVIMNNLDLGGAEHPWEPLPRNENNIQYEFTGVLDGLGCTISGIYINNNEDYQGLFGTLNGTVRNLNITNSHIQGNNNVGAIAGTNEENGLIENCFNRSTVIGVNYVGGITGSTNGTVKNCKNIGSIIGTTNVTGGYFYAMDDNSNSPTPVEVWSKTRTLSQNYKFKSGTDVATVPKGFKVSANIDEQTIADGMVIQDSDENEFVWVPVVNPTRDIVKKTILGAVSNEDIQTIINSNIYPIAVRKKVEDSNTVYDYIGVLYDFSGQQQLALTSLYEDQANATGYEEPEDLTTGEENTESFYKTEYNHMVASVATYMGFYVGRYEISLDSTSTYAQSKKNQTALVSNTWYTMYEKETKYATSTGNLGVNSYMIWGSQWDQLMLFVNGKKDGEGNNFYITTTGSRKSGNLNTKTGMNEKDKVCNIYDLEAGRQEWTQEANGFARKNCKRWKL